MLESLSTKGGACSSSDGAGTAATTENPFLFGNRGGGSLRNDLFSNTSGDDSASVVLDVQHGGGSGRSGLNLNLHHETGAAVAPPASTSNNEISKLLAKEMMELSVQEGNAALQDIHGTSSYEEESPQFLHHKIQQVRLELSKLQKRSLGSCAAYTKANFLAPTRTSKNDKFLIMFLRAKSYDPKLAAHCVVQHFEYKLRLFGIKKSTQTSITYDDLNEDDIHALQSGYSLVLPGKDASGRLVCVVSSKYATCKSWNNQIRANWFQLMTAIQHDESVQIRGIVLVVYDVDRTYEQVHNQSFSEHLSNLTVYTQALPIHVASCHYCFNKPSLMSLISLYHHCINSSTNGGIQRRYQIHYGGHVECQYELLSHGVPSSIFHLDHNGDLIKKRVELAIAMLVLESEQYNQRKGRSQCTNNTNNAVEKGEIGAEDEKDAHLYVECATDRDVLLGRGIPYQTHPGNMILAKLVETKVKDYSNSWKVDKTAITWGIVNQMKDEFGGRFLARICDDDDDDTEMAVDGDDLTRDRDVSALIARRRETTTSSTSSSIAAAWKICSDEVARSKVAVSFRSKMKMERQRNQKQQQQQQQQQHSCRNDFK